MDSKHRKISERVYKKVNNYLIRIAGNENADYILDKLGRGKSFIDTICLLPIWFNECFEKNKKYKEVKELLSLSEANLKAWIGYTMYDYLRDGKISKDKLVTCLSVANICTNDSIKVFLYYAGNDDKKYIIDLINTVDLYYVNQRKPKSFSEIEKTLFKKSIAASIAAFLVIPTNINKKRNMKHTLAFFKYYFTARLLSDDLDDYKKDLRFKILTSVTFLIDKNKNTSLFIRKRIDKNLLTAKKQISFINNFNAESFIQKYVKNC